MNTEIRLNTSKEYYQEFYSESLKRTKRKWEPLLATCLIVFGGVLYLINTSENLKFIPVLFVFAGIYELLKFYYSKRKWLKDRLQNGIINKEVVLVFQDECIRYEGPFSKGDLKWQGIQKTALTDKGLFLIPENGFSIYIPKKLFRDATEIKEIVQKVNEIHQNSST